jgi:hypothetical protein
MDQRECKNKKGMNEESRTGTWTTFDEDGDIALQERLSVPSHLEKVEGTSNARRRRKMLRAHE